MAGTAALRVEEATASGGHSGSRAPRTLFAVTLDAGHSRPRPRRTRGRGIRPWLIQMKLLGLAGFLGGLAALSAMTLLGPEPESMEGWRTLQEAMRAIFFPCVFVGLLIAIAAGICLLLQHPRQFIRLRWFRLKAILLLVLLPTLHFWSRGRVNDFHAAIEEGNLQEAADNWERVSVTFTVALVAGLCIAWIGKYKPRLGEPYGRRAVRRNDEAGQ